MSTRAYASALRAEAGKKLRTARRERYWEIDFLRGVCVLLMVFDHFMYCLWDVMPAINSFLGTSLFAGLRETAMQYWNWNVRENVRGVVICMFFVLCGISCTLTRGNLRRFVPLAAVAVGISCVTYIIDELFLEGIFIMFGVIHMIACGVLMFAVLDNAVSAVCALFPKGESAKKAETILRYLPGVFGVVLLIVEFSCFADLRVTDGAVELVSSVQSSGDYFTDVVRSIFIELRGFNFLRETNTSDYFPLLPYTAVILAGSILGRAIYHTRAKNALRPLDGSWNGGICLLGRHSAFIFVAEMVVIPLFLALCAFLTTLF